jgi:chromosome segregation ATPase
MSEKDTAEAKRRAEWLHKHKAHKDWVILSVSEISVIRAELEATERERDEARKHLKEIEEYGTEEINAAIDLRRNLAQALVDLDDMQYQRDEARELAKEADLGHDMAISDLTKCETELAEATTKLAEISSLTESIVEKANELIDRWDQPSWKDTAPTAGFINALRNAVEAYEKKPND